MDKISLWCKKYSLLLNNTFLLKKTIIEEIEKITNIKISKDKIMVNNNNIKLNLTPIEKAEIFIHKEQILKALNKDSNNFINIK